MKARHRPSNPPITRGIPAGDAFFLPAIDSQAIKNRGGYDEEVRWELSDVIEHVFPRQYQAKYNEIATALVAGLMARGELSGQDLAGFVKRNNYSKATFYNKVIPRLRRVGMIKRERLGKAILLSLSDSFGSYLKKISSEWVSLVKTSKRRKEVKH